MDFRSRLIATLKAVRPVLEEPGVLVLGSEVPNLLQDGAAATLVVSKDVDLGIPVSQHARVKLRLGEIDGLKASTEEPSVWLPEREELIEVNFLGIDHAIQHPSETYVLEDDLLPLMVFGPLSWVSPATPIEVEGLVVPVPRKAGMILEKLVTDRSGVKGDRDLLVVAGILPLCDESDLEELETLFRRLPAELQYAVCSNLTLLSLLDPVRGMPDPGAQRRAVASLLRRLQGEAG